MIVLLLALPVVVLADENHQTVARTPSMESCDFYLDMEKELHCSEQSNNGSTYLTLYGHKYCARFRRMSGDWTGKPKEWVDRTGMCLQEMLADNSKRIAPCSQMEEFAFDAHPICYKQYGFCELDAKYRDQIMDEVSAIDIIEQPRRTLTQVINVATKCGFGKNMEVLFEHILHGANGFSQSDRTVVANVFLGAPKGTAKRSQYFNDVFPILVFGSNDSNAVSFSEYYPTLTGRNGDNSSAPASLRFDVCLASKIDAKDKEKCDRIKGLATNNGSKKWNWSNLKPKFSMSQVNRALELQKNYK